VTLIIIWDVNTIKMPCYCTDDRAMRPMYRLFHPYLVYAYVHYFARISFWTNLSRSEILLLTPPYSILILGVFPLAQIAHVGVSPSIILKLFGRKIIFDVLKPCEKHTSTHGQTDGQTDRQTLWWMKMNINPVFSFQFSELHDQYSQPIERHA